MKASRAFLYALAVLVDPSRDALPLGCIDSVEDHFDADRILSDDLSRPKREELAEFCRGWDGLADDAVVSRLQWERASVERTWKQKRDSKQAPPKSKKRGDGPGRPSTAERDKELAREFENINGSFADFARKHNVKLSTMRTAIERGRQAIYKEQKRN